MRIAVIGVGLIGGSVGLAARERIGAHVSAWDMNPATLSQARSVGAIDTASRSLDDALEDAEVAFVAAPVDALPELVGAVIAAAPAGCVVTDVGSTKRSVVEACSDPRFVGGHPLAGSESSGVEHARSDLFEGATWYLTPGPATARETTLRVEEFIATLGAQVREIEPAAHDRLMATVSHLPHVFANVLVAQLAATDADAVPGPSFRDATRVAGSNTAVWSGIYVENREALGAAIDDAVARLVEVRAALAAGDREALVRWSEQAAADRAKLGR
jgi:prephenate dehydrogenase